MKKDKKLIPKRLGFVNVLLVLLVIALAILLSGALLPKGTFPTPGSETSTPLGTGNASACCDSGDGDACGPIPGKTLTYGGQEYGLIKSSITMNEAPVHLDDSKQKDLNGNPIIINTTDTYYAGTSECGGKDIDQLTSYNNGALGCVPVPNDEIIYLCRANCGPTVPKTALELAYCGKGVTCYGDKTTVYDAYFRLSDIPTPGIPNAIKNCSKQAPPGEAPQVTQAPAQPTIVFNSQPGQDNLQLQTFTLIAPPPAQTTVSWLSPYCKPAVYLYPQTSAFVSVKLNSSQPLTYSDPKYEDPGWGVIADPTGLITYQNKPYDYLYYETKVADSDYQKPEQGFVVEQAELKQLFGSLLPKLGLNIRESQQFSDYWTGVLPKSPYYFVGVVPQSKLESLTSLNILPRPATEIRVTLYFEALKDKISVEAPIITTPKRTGFTVVEWGGIFKKSKDSKFSCYQ